MSVPFLFVPVGVVISGRLLESDVCQHVPHGHHQTIHFLVELLSGSGHFHVVLQLGSTLQRQAEVCSCSQNGTNNFQSAAIKDWNIESACWAAVLLMSETASTSRHYQDSTVSRSSPDQGFIYRKTGAVGFFSIIMLLQCNYLGLHERRDLQLLENNKVSLSLPNKY